MPLPGVGRLKCCALLGKPLPRRAAHSRRGYLCRAAACAKTKQTFVRRIVFQKYIVVVPLFKNCILCRGYRHYMNKRTHNRKLPCGHEVVHPHGSRADYGACQSTDDRTDAFGKPSAAVRSAAARKKRLVNSLRKSQFGMWRYLSFMCVSPVRIAKAR